ncbi:HpcH/HpaI aldolase family protein [Acetobacter fallax]|uniref:2,4-dihydroxyhept-2-ene-1,7-dioic acid aldolase n=1 Tax=Acetobacter fallax TaxID=1737473 RepID=A0ABX0KIA7_9PROT|nr:aldolase/citrate lyase family protein [Acetobacter fallax]NHO34125.1 2,4-dihydroxyhept-2-ene-1,7-dioic acid aldolase [Acetobacter fallax]NHO37663.1 2,4-dihydroxyhept-2-ene-1,7-dioic acid aldolase [Acetobacter fallax]
MSRNPIRRIWAEGGAVLNGWLSIANPFSAEIMASAGYDSVTIDTQHGAIGYEGMLGMLQAMRASGVAPLVRSTWLEPASIMKALDAGAWGVICPMVNSRADAERLVSYVRYPPRGCRSFGPTRANFALGGDYGAVADDEVLCFAMIETAEAMANLDEIVRTPGLDGVYVGPADLTLGLTGRRYRTGFDREEPEMLEAIQRIMAAARTAGIRMGLHNGSSAYAARAIGWGCDLVTVSNDVRLLAQAAQDSVAEVRRRAQAGDEVAGKTTLASY